MIPSALRVTSALLIITALGHLPAAEPIARAETFSVSDERQSTTIKEDNYATSLDDSKGAKAAGPAAAGQRNSYALGELSGIYGANLSATFRWYRDIDNQDSNPDFLRWALQERVALWTSFAMNGWRGYLRGSMTNIDRGVGPTYTGIGADVEGPSLDLAFLVKEVMAFNIAPVKMTLGRQVQYVGRGLSYYAVSDGIQIETVGTSPLTQKYFAARTLPRQDNIDFSVPGFDKEGDRYFYGAEWGYNGIPRISLYGYVFGQEDASGENPVRPSQEYHYDSFYYGSGFAARPFGQLQLWGEIVGETGQGYTDATRGRLRETEVDAWAWILGGKHPWNLPTKPVLEFEAAYGSGDPDRILVTNTVNGSADERDTNFLYFGYFAAGYAFQPRLSNLYVYSAGFNFQPLEKVPGFERFLIGSKAYLYFKDEMDGGTSDFESAGQSDNLGREWDAYIHWQVLPSVLWSFRYGIFIPTDGFPIDLREPTQFFYTRLSWDY